jgi:hypothetical protein
VLIDIPTIDIRVHGTVGAISNSMAERSANKIDAYHQTTVCRTLSLVNPIDDETSPERVRDLLNIIR